MSEYGVASNTSNVPHEMGFDGKKKRGNIFLTHTEAKSFRYSRYLLYFFTAQENPTTT